MLKKLTVFVFATFFTYSAFAHSQPDVFEWMNQVIDNPKLCNKKSIKQYFTKDVVFKFNGEIRAKKRKALLKRVSKLLKANAYKPVHIKKQWVAPQSHIKVVNYQLTRKAGSSGQYDSFDIVAFLTFDGGKIKSWDAVAVPIKS
jgi:hypothetical protein